MLNAESAKPDKPLPNMTAIYGLKFSFSNISLTYFEALNGDGNFDI